MSTVGAKKPVIDDDSKTVTIQYEEMIKTVLHLRMKTAKMTQEAEEVNQPELKQKIEVFKLAKDSNDLAVSSKKVVKDEILTFEEVKEKFAHLCNNTYENSL